MDVAASLKLLDQLIEKYHFGQQPRELYQPMHYMLKLDQERLCPLLTLWGCHLFSGNIQKSLLPGLGVGVFYNFFLLHEDLLDRNPNRGGAQSVYEKWNDNVAILSGDAMIFKAYELLIEVETHLIKPVIRLFNSCFTRVCEGKQLALNHLDRAVHATPLDILQLNPGALTAFSLQLGGLIGGATMEQSKQMGNLGNALGVLWGLHKNEQNQKFPISVIQSVKEQMELMDCDKNRKVVFSQYIKEQFSITV